MTFADLLASLPSEMRAIAAADPHLPFVLDAVVRAKHRDARASERKMKRVMLVCCPCGFVNGEDYCPWCDDGIPTTADVAAREKQDAERRETVRKAMEALAPRPKADGVPLPGNVPRAPNRFERRRAASRRWRG